MHGSEGKRLFPRLVSKTEMSIYIPRFPTYMNAVLRNGSRKRFPQVYTARPNPFESGLLGAFCIKVLSEM